MKNENEITGTIIEIIRIKNQATSSRRLAGIVGQGRKEKDEKRSERNVQRRRGGDPFLSESRTLLAKTLTQPRLRKWSQARGAPGPPECVTLSLRAPRRHREEGFGHPQNWRNYRISSDKNECTGVRRSRISELHRAQEETNAVKEWRSCAARQRRTQRLLYRAVFTQISCSWQCSATTECLAKAREANNSPFQHPGASRAANHFAQHWQQQLTSAHGNPEGPRSPIPCNVLLQTLVVATALKKL